MPVADEDGGPVQSRHPHNFWRSPCHSSLSARLTRAEPTHSKKATRSEYPVFFESKTTGFVRTCSAVTEAGLSLARDYNALALKLWRERLDEGHRVEGLNWQQVIAKPGVAEKLKDLLDAIEAK